MRVSDDYVQDNTPGNEMQMSVRFYFYVQGDGRADIFQAFPDEFAVAPDFSVNVNAATLELSLPQSVSTSTLGVRDGWNFIEIQLGLGTNRLWLNADPLSDPPSMAFNWDSAVDAVRLGAIDPVGDITVFVDEYASFRTVSIGPAMLGDANGDMTIDEADIDAVLDEVLGEVLNRGLPDCNLDTRVDVQDALCIGNLISPKANRFLPFADRKIIEPIEIFTDSFDGVGGGPSPGILQIPPEVLVPDPDETSPMLVIDPARGLNGEAIDLPLLFDAADAEGFQFFVPYDPADLTADVSMCGVMTMELTIRCAADNGIIAVAGFGSGAVGMADIGTIALTPTNAAEGPIPLDIASPLFAVDDQSLLPVVTMGGEILVSAFFDGFEAQ